VTAGMSARDNIVKQEIRDRYDSMASSAAHPLGPRVNPARAYFWERKLTTALALGSFRRGGNLLEIGCNVGQFSFALADQGYRVTGVDLSAAAISVAQRKAAEYQRGAISFCVGDAEELKDFGDNQFDGVVSFSTLRYAPNVSKALGEMRRVLKPGETALVDFPNRLCPWFYLKSWFGSESHPHDRWHTAGEAKALFTQAGFTDLRVKRILFTPTIAPDRLLPAFQALDGVLERTPLLRSFAGIIMIAARKP